MLRAAVVGSLLIVQLNAAEAREVRAAAVEHYTPIIGIGPAHDDLHVQTATHSTNHGQEWGTLGAYEQPAVPIFYR